MFLMMSTNIRSDLAFLTCHICLLHLVKQDLKLVWICESSWATNCALKNSVCGSFVVDLKIIQST